MEGSIWVHITIMGMFAFDSTEAETKTNVHAGQCAMTADCKTHHINADATMSCRLAEHLQCKQKLRQVLTHVFQPSQLGFGHLPFHWGETSPHLLHFQDCLTFTLAAEPAP